VSHTVAAWTERDFDEELGSSELPLLVEFWTEWCPPCKAIAPILDELAQEHGDRLRIVKVNSDENPSLAARFEVMAVPTLLVFDEGHLVKRMMGARGKRQLLEELNSVLTGRQGATSSAVQSAASPS